MYVSSISWPHTSLPSAEPDSHIYESIENYTDSSQELPPVKISPDKAPSVVYSNMITSRPSSSAVENPYANTGEW